MTTRLDSAVEAVMERCGSSARARIQRIDVEHNAVVHVTLQGDDEDRWFRYDERLVELFATTDDRLPLSGCAADGEQAAGRVLSYRPGRRLVIRGDRNGEAAVLKGYRRRRSHSAARAHRAALRANSDAFRLPALLEHREPSSCLVFELLAGQPMHATVAAADHFFAAGALLRLMQASDAGEGLPHFTVKDELEVLDRWAHRASLVGCAIPDGWRAARTELAYLADTLPQLAARPAHRDLHDKQLLLTPEGIALLDFDLFCRADVALDPANMLAHLTLRSLQGLNGSDEAGANACGEALLEGLDRGREPSFWRRLRFYQATTFLRLSLLYGLRPRWSRLAPTLLALGNRCLSELGSC